MYFSLTGTVSTSPNLAKEGAHSATISVLFCYILKLFSLTGTVSTSPNLAKARARRASNDCRATRSSLAKFGEVDTVPVSEKCDNPRMTRY